MPDNFDRITRDPTVKSGLPCIRYTGIAVYEVLHLIAQGVAFADILAQYPALELTDIEQAVGHTIKDTAQAAKDTQLEILLHLTSARSRIEWISRISEQDDKLRKAIDQALRHVKDVELVADTLRLWALMHFDPKAMTYREKVSLPEVIDDMMSKINPPQSVELDIPADLPTLACPYRLIMVLSALIYFSPSFGSSDGTDLKTRITARVQGDRVEIRLRLRLKLFNRFASPQKPFENFLLMPAAIFMQVHGSALTVDVDADYVTYRFTLPIWQGDSAA